MLDERTDGTRAERSASADRRAPVHSHAHSHSHGGPLDIGPAERRRVRALLAAIVVPLAALTLVALIVLWPKGETPVGSRPLSDKGVEYVKGKITSVGQTDKNGQTPVKMRVSGVEVPVHVPAEIVANGLEPGDEILAMFYPKALESGVVYIFQDFVRTGPMLALLLLYVVAVVLVARIKGLMALIGLGVSLGVVGAFMIPALTVSSHPVMVVLVASAAMMFASIYLAHGVSIRTTTAVLGTFSGLLITTGLAWWAVETSNLTGALSEEARNLRTPMPGIDLQALLLGGIILAGLGALNDVTITQVSTVWELHAANPRLARRRLFLQGMAVGRDHIASTVYTLAFAYVGTAITLLLSASIIQRPTLELLQLGEIAEEIVRTLVASVGLVLAIPLTTAVAAMLAPVAPGGQTGAREPAGERESPRRPDALGRGAPADGRPPAARAKRGAHAAQDAPADDDAHG